MDQMTGNSLRKIYLFFVVKILISAFISFFVAALLFFVLGCLGIFNFADSAERGVNKILHEIGDASFSDVSELLLNTNEEISYILYCYDNDEIISNLTPETRDYILSERLYLDDYDGKYYYKYLEKSKYIAIFVYEIKTSYFDSRLNVFLPDPQIIAMIFSLIMFFVFCLVNIVRLSNYLRNELELIREATNQILKQNLNYDIRYSDVKEINEILYTFSSMKTALTESLDRQWNMQHEQRKAIAALAHDIKTPMTVTMGSLDLLMLTNLDKEQRELTNSAIKEIGIITNYIDILTKDSMDMLKYREEIIDVITLTDELLHDIHPLIKIKNIEIEKKILISKGVIAVDRDMITRALKNIVQNAIYQISENGKIGVTINEENNDIVLVIQDSGKGFSKYLLNNATELFKTYNQNVSGDHYGMGLHFVENVVKRQGGKLVLSNDSIYGGANVKIYLKQYIN